MAATTVHAEEECCPEDGLPQPALQSLAQEIGIIGYGVALPDGRTFAMDDLQKRALRLHYFVDSSEQRKCARSRLTGENTGARKSRESKHLTWLARGSIDPSYGLARSPSAMGEAVPGLILDSEKINSLSNWVCAESKNINRKGCRANEGRLLGALEYPDSQMLDQAFKWSKEGDMSGISPVDRKVGLLGTEFDEKQVREELKVWKAYYRILEASGDPHHRKETFKVIKAMGEGLSTEQKIKVISLLGAVFNSNYDKKRATLDVRAMGVVDSMEILYAAGNNDLASTYKDPKKADDWRARLSPEQVAGVCRDIAATQAEILNAMGLESYVLTTSEGIGGHAVLIARDPHDKDRTTYQVNYDDIRRWSKEDAFDPNRLLARGWDSSMGTPEHSMTYELYRPTTGFVSMTYSEFGKVLTEMSGGSVRTLDPLAKIDNSVTAVEAGKARAFVARDRFNNSYLGVAASQRFLDRETVTIDSSLLLGVRDFASAGGPNQRDQSFYVYGSVRGTWNQPIIRKSGPNGTFTLQSEEMFESTGMMDTALSDKKPNFAGELNSKVGLRAHTEVGRIKADAVAAVALPFRPLDVRGTSIIIDYLVPQFQHVELSADVRARLTQSDTAYAGVMATVLCGQLGCRGKGELYAVYQNVAASIAYEGRMMESMPGYVDGTEKRISGQLRAQFEQYGLPLWISLNGNHSTDTSATGLGAGMGGSF